MRNYGSRSGVYHPMRPVSLLLLCSLTVLAQPSRQQDPLDAAIQAVWQAGNGHPQDVPSLRDRARTLLRNSPADAPQFGNRVQQVAQLYQNAGLNAQSRAVLEEALTRVAPLGLSDPGRLTIVRFLADSWERDGNWLKSAAYLEQVASAPPAPPPPVQLPGQSMGLRVAVYGAVAGRVTGGYPNGRPIDTYIQLANLYQRLGRPDAVAAVTEKIRSLAANDPATLARFYEQRGQLDDAAAIYQKMVEQSADPQAKINSLQSLASLISRQEHFADAVASMQEAIAIAQTSDRPGISNQTVWMRQTLAGYLNRAGQTGQADQIYQQLLNESQGSQQEFSTISGYAQFLSDGDRSTQAEAMLKEYLANHPGMEGYQKANALYSLANVARKKGDTAAANEYQKQAQTLQQPPPPPAGQVLIAGEIQQAQTAINQGRFDEGYGLALHAITASTAATDGQQVDWAVPQMATNLSAHKETAKAAQLFQLLFATVQSDPVAGIQRSLNVTRNYQNYLMNQHDRWDEVAAAIEQYRRILVDANGAGSGTLIEPLQMKIQFERNQSRWPQAIASSQELLELQQSLSGNTSEPYLRDLQTATRVYEDSGDLITALSMRRQAIAIADLFATPATDWNRAQTRMDAALTLARIGQFDDAEALGEASVAMETTMRRGNLAPQLEQIRHMKQAALTAAANRAARQY